MVAQRLVGSLSEGRKIITDNDVNTTKIEMSAVLVLFQTCMYILGYVTARKCNDTTVLKGFWVAKSSLGNYFFETDYVDSMDKFFQLYYLELDDLDSANFSSTVL